MIKVYSTVVYDKSRQSMQLESYLKWASTFAKLKEKKLLKKYFFIDIDLTFQSKQDGQKKDSYQLLLLNEILVSLF